MKLGGMVQEGDGKSLNFDRIPHLMIRNAASPVIIAISTLTTDNPSTASARSTTVAPVGLARMTIMRDLQFNRPFVFLSPSRHFCCYSLIMCCHFLVRKVWRKEVHRLNSECSLGIQYVCSSACGSGCLPCSFVLLDLHRWVGLQVHQRVLPVPPTHSLGSLPHPHFDRVVSHSLPFLPYLSFPGPGGFWHFLYLLSRVASICVTFISSSSHFRKATSGSS